jgi:hypothetical protein
MSTVQEIEAAIARLPKDEFWKLTDRLIAMREDAWDREMEEDARPGGPLDRLAGEALREYAEGKTRQLP